ncbi:zinc-binding alcohol dehydrogenase [Halomicrobium sp. HM KBTZ05]|uniref:Zinc-binding dehydrogenase n=1 Tax=Halomicrobium mukohataei TaxID=57705 RepID=A0A847U967_9EURY|nr:zinc-binding alcohol dehydrogenase [Halomicrobium mukohataei]NLV09549.1 zinc-binding dehydrogenase [Halomicrobium mukohataei]
MVQTLYFTAEREAAIRDRPARDLDAEAVRVETAVSAISAGTELLIYRGDAPEELVADEELDALSGDLAFPLSYGYAAVGTVVDTGSTVADDWRGRRVFAFNPHETSFTAPVSAVVPVPQTMDTETAAHLPSVETAVNFALDGQPRVGERVVVYGAGTIGLCTTSVLASFPLAELVVVDPVEQRRALAERFGADRAVAPGDEIGFADREPDGADLVYELSGNPEALDDAVGTVGYDGRIVVGSWYGTNRADLGLGGRFHRDRITIESSQVSTIAPELRGRWSNERRLETALEHLDDITTDALVYDRVPFASAPEAYRRLDEHCPPGGIILTY